MGYLRLTVRALLGTSILLTCLTLMLGGSLLGRRGFNRSVMQWALRSASRAWGIRWRIVGEPAQQRPLLLVSNHFSYIDIFVIGSVLPAAFTPKSEIAKWPLIGPMCRMAGCLFIDRRASQTMKNKKLLDAALAKGEIISLFPEGTTNDGTVLLPFRSGLFSLPVERGIAVQPLSLDYTSFNGKPLDADGRAKVGWYGDAEFFPHLAEFLKHEKTEVTLHFHPVILPEGHSRKDLAHRSEERVASALSLPAPASGR